MVGLPFKLRDFLKPATPFRMVEVHYIFVGPFHARAQSGYLLIDPIKGVA